ncbi:zeta toxin family protein [Streptomyces niveus]|uniref:zeta toxin family protein n=1 Tax=Streptomyces niveus TaxID=193462 RepID=UPI0036C5564D
MLFAIAGLANRRSWSMLLAASDESGSAQEFMGSALPFAGAGYPVELVVLAVRADDSRFATALRYARAQQTGVNGRFTSEAGHDQYFCALSDVVALAQRHPAITAITVIRRDGPALAHHEASAAGAARSVPRFTSDDTGQDSRSCSHVLVGALILYAHPTN